MSIVVLSQFINSIRIGKTVVGFQLAVMVVAIIMWFRLVESSVLATLCFLLILWMILMCRHILLHQMWFVLWSF